MSSCHVDVAALAERYTCMGLILMILRDGFVEAGTQCIFILINGVPIDMFIDVFRIFTYSHVLGIIR